MRSPRAATRKHITMGAVIRWLPERYKVAAGVAADLFAAVFCAAFAYFALAFVRDSRDFGDTLLGASRLVAAIDHARSRLR